MLPVVDMPWVEPPIVTQQVAARHQYAVEYENMAWSEGAWNIMISLCRCRQIARLLWILAHAFLGSSRTVHSCQVAMPDFKDAASQNGLVE